MRGNILRKILFFVLLLLICIPITIVKANSCDYKFKAEATKIAKNVTASYEIKQSETGSYYIEITIYNIVDGLYVRYETSDSGSYSSDKNIFNSDTGGTNNYTFIDYDIDKVKKFTFKVYSTNYECNSHLRSFTLTKPMYNKYSELPECSYYEVEDFLYCQKWITTNFNMSEAAVIERINQQRNKYKSSMTTVCVSCDEENEYYKWLERFNNIKRYIIIGLSIGIIADITVIILLARKIKEDSII